MLREGRHGISIIRMSSLWLRGDVFGTESDLWEMLPFYSKEAQKRNEKNPLLWGGGTSLGCAVCTHHCVCACVCVSPRTVCSTDRSFFYRGYLTPGCMCVQARGLAFRQSAEESTSICVLKSYGGPPTRTGRAAEGEFTHRPPGNCDLQSVTQIPLHWTHGTSCGLGLDSL